MCDYFFGILYHAFTHKPLNEDEVEGNKIFIQNLKHCNMSSTFKLSIISSNLKSRLTPKWMANPTSITNMVFLKGDKKFILLYFCDVTWIFQFATLSFLTCHAPHLPYFGFPCASKFHNNHDGPWTQFDPIHRNKCIMDNKSHAF